MRPDQRTDGDSDLEAPTATTLVPSAFAVPPGSDAPAAGPATEPAVSPAPGQTRAPLGALAFGILGGFVGGALSALIVSGLTTGPDPANNVPLVVGLENRVGALETGGASATGDLEGLRIRVAELENRPVARDVAPVDAPSAASVESLETRLRELMDRTAALESVGQRASAVEDLEARVAALQRRVEEQPLDRRSAQAVALAGLQSALSRGTPFTNELASVERLAGKPDAQLEALKPYAAAGIPTATAIRQDFSAAGNAVTSAMATAGADGVLERLLANARSAVRIRTTTPSEGSAPEAILSRIDAAFAASEPSRALSEWRTLPEAARKAAPGFEDKLAARVAADEAMTALTAALAAPPAE